MEDTFYPQPVVTDCVAKYTCSLPHRAADAAACIVMKSAFGCPNEVGKMWPHASHFTLYLIVFHVEADIGVVVVNLPQ